MSTPQPGFTGAGVYSVCPVLLESGPCAWKIRTDQHTGPEARPVALMAVPGGVVDRAIRRFLIDQAADMERILREHLETHDILDWLRTIRQLDARSTALTEALELLDQSIDTDPCALDHNSNCQAHLWFPFDNGASECRQARTKRFVAAHQQEDT